MPLKSRRILQLKKLSMIFAIGSMLALAACAPSTPEEPVDTFKTEKINVYTRDTTSGTRDGFMRGIGFADAAANDSVLVAGFVTADNNAIMSAMATDKAGIGYVSLSSVNNTIKPFKFEGVEATEANVLNDTYGLKRPFVLMRRVDGDYVNDTEYQLTLAFMAFLASNDGADVIANAGAVSTNGTGSWATLVADHPVCALDNSAVTLKFGGSDSVQKIAEALSKAFSPACGNVQTENDHTGSSDGWKRTQGDQKDGTVYKHIGYSSRFFRDAELAGPEGTRMQMAWDAIVAIGHKDNPVDNLTAAQLTAIYNGTSTVWGDFYE
jgi:phosphate transport system substrate-binding protein